MAVKGMSKATPMNVLNTIRGNASSDYQERVPIATRANIATVGNAITEYEPTRNEFLNSLVNRIGMVLIKSRLYENPLASFKRGMLEFGKDIEEIFVEIASAQSYNPELAESEVFKRVIPDVKTIFHRVNRQDFYKVTVSNDQLRTAFLSYGGIEDLIGRIVDSLYSGDNFDEFLLMKNLMQDYGNNGLFYPITVPEVTNEQTAKALTVTLRATAKTLGFMNKKYNAQGVHTFTSIDDINIFMTPQTEALMDVESLARAFNLSYADFLGRVVIVDDFGGLENVQALMVDRDWFMVYDQFFNFTEQYNAQGLYWNYFFHHWQVLSTSQFANAVAFTTETPRINSVSISPQTSTASKGQNVQLTATVDSQGMATETVVWSIQEVNAKSTITSSGLVYIASDETLSSITPVATSVFDNTLFDKATITIASTV